MPIIKAHLLRLIPLLFILLLGTFLPASPVLADVAPPPPPFGSNPAGDNPNTQVQMISEKVIFELASVSSHKDGQAKVTATFQMRNQGTQEEKMVVRFPLGPVSQGSCIDSPYPPINDLVAWVNGVSTATTTSYQTVTAPIDNSAQQVTIPCWANFPVTFSVGKDVSIEVQYTALGYGNANVNTVPDNSRGFAGDDPSAEVSYWYILQTGAGWYGPIERADIIFRFPYQVNNQDVDFGSTDSAWVPSGNQLAWHQEKFEPDSDLHVYLTNPVVWQSILTETTKLKENPIDGKAWGMVGSAFKQAIWERRGFRQDPGGVEMYKLSDQAYQKALNFLTKDPDLHFGYAELLCWHAEWGHLDDNSQGNNPDWIPCLQQIKSALDLNPQHTKAKEALQEIAQFFPGLVDLKGAHPDYLLLTPQPTPILKTTSTMIPSQAIQAPTETLQDDPAAYTITPAPILITAPTATVRATTFSPSPSSAGSLEYGAIGLLLIVTISVILFWRRKQMH
jgi:hypothetical protein